MPLLTELAEMLPKAIRATLPEAKEPLRKALNVLANPASKESITAVEASMRHLNVPMDAAQWEMWRNLSIPVATAARSKRLGTSMLDSGLSIMDEYLTNSNQLAKRGREAFELGRKAELPKIPDLDLPADTRALSLQGDWHRVSRELRKAKAVGDTKKVEDLRGKMEFLQRAVPPGQRLVEDIPVQYYYAPAGPKPKFERALGPDTPVLDKAAMDAFTANVHKSLTSWWHGLTGKGGPGKGFADLNQNKEWIKDFSKLHDELDPWLERYYANMNRIGKDYRPKIQAIVDTNKGKSMEEIAALPEYQKVAKKIQKIMPQVNADLAEINKRFEPVARKWFTRPGAAGADTRIALYREPNYRGWVENLMEPGEKEIAAAHQKLMGEVRGALEKRGIPVFEAEQDYVHHSLRHLLSGGKISRITSREADRAYRLASRISPFVHRNYGSLPLFPSIHGSTKGYIATAARKMGMTDFKSKWLGLLYGKDAPLAEYPRLAKFTEKYVKQFEENMFNDAWWEKMAHRGTMWMYATKVWGTASAPFKHALKFVRILSTHPTDAIRTLPKATKAGLQIALQRFGVQPGKEARLIRNFTASRDFFEAMSGIKPDKRLLDIANNVGNFGIGFTEMIERGWTTMIAISKAQRKGLSMQDAMRGMWSTVLSNNFLGGADRPLWLRKSWQQFMAPFFYTPTRVTEETVGMVLRSLPHRVIKEMGEDALKISWNMMPRDAFGTPYVKHMLSFAGATGALELYARAHDTSLWSIIAAHIPGMRPTATGVEPGIPPAQLLLDFKRRGGDIEALTSSLYDFLTTTPMLDKIKQMSQGTTSPVYDKDWRRVMFSLPSLKAIETAKKRAAEKQVVPSAHFNKWLDQQRRLKTFFGPWYPVTHKREAGKPWTWGFPKPEK